MTRRNGLALLPSAGSIVDGHLLAVTEEHFLSLGASDESGSDIPDFLNAVMRYYPKAYNVTGVSMLEHGSRIGDGSCDPHGHAHFFPFGKEFLDAVEAERGQPGTRVTNWNQVRAAAKRGSYILYGNTSSGLFIYESPQNLPHQYARTIAAQLTGMPLDEVDWQLGPRMENFRRTMDGGQILVAILDANLDHDSSMTRESI